MEDMTVQTVPALTEEGTVQTDCERPEATDASAAVPSQDTERVSDAPAADVATDASANGVPTAQANAEEMTYMPVYKGKVIPIKANDREEITTLLQLGMKQREMQPLMEDLQLLATQCGAKSIRELIESSRRSYEEQALSESIAAYGEKEGLARFEREREAARQSIAPPTDERAAMHERLAGEFIELREAFPDYARVSDLPTDVVQTALTQGISLTDALLRYRHAEQRRVEAEKAAAKSGAARSIGSLQQAAGQTTAAVMDAFLRGLHRRL